MNPTTNPSQMTPEQQATFKQNWINSFMSGAQQPSAQLGETQAAAAAAGASANVETANLPAAQVKSQQALAPQNLQKELKKGLTLTEALSKYTALGMNADDIFKQYLAENTYGPNKTPKLPVEDVQTLKNLGVTTSALGNIGDPGSFMDKYNTKNAINELRNLEDSYSQANPLAKNLPILGGDFPSARAYNTAKTVFGNHLASLIPGASGAQATGQSLLGQLPNIGDPFEPGAASGQFAAMEKQLLASKGYTEKDLGLPTRPGSSTNTEPTALGFGGNVIKSGGDLLNGILNTPASVMAQGRQGMEEALKTGNMQDISTPNSLIVNALTGYLGNLNKDAGEPLKGGDILKRITTNAYKNPVGVAADLLPLLGAAKLGAVGKAAGGAGEGSEAVKAATADVPTTEASFENAPGFLKQVFRPSAAQKAIGGIRDTLVKGATDAGKTIDGNTVFKDFQDFLSNARGGNLGQGKALTQAEEDAAGVFKDKQLTPKQAANMYKEADNGFAKNGQPKTPIQANIDRGIRDVLSKHLEASTPGWNKTTQLFAQGYKVAKTASTLKKTAIGVAGVTGATRLAHLLGAF